MNRTLALLILAACGSDDRPTVAASPTAPPALTSATPLDLARDLDLAEARGTWSGVQRKWQGQVLRWTVTRHRTLCRTAAACNVAAFAVQRPAKHGWLPELAFAPGQFAALEARCGTAESCEVAIEGTLDKLELSAELPTNLRLGNVRIVTTTAQR